MNQTVINDIIIARMRELVHKLKADYGVANFTVAPNGVVNPPDSPVPLTCVGDARDNACGCARRTLSGEKAQDKAAKDLRSDHSDYAEKIKYNPPPSHGGYADSYEDHPTETYVDEKPDIDLLPQLRHLDVTCFLKVGDVVNLHGGYPADMNIVFIDHLVGTVKCAWFNEDCELQAEQFPLACLTLSDPQPNQET
jgi:uncharacterized protein YodC (DUF2158 family)